MQYKSKIKLELYIDERNIKKVRMKEEYARKTEQ